MIPALIFDGPKCSKICQYTLRIFSLQPGLQYLCVPTSFWTWLRVAKDVYEMNARHKYVQNIMIVFITDSAETFSAVYGWSTICNTLRPRWNEPHFADDIFKRIFFNENVWISIKISLKFVPKGPINNIPALVQIMAWRRSGDKPLSEPMMISLPTHICVTRPQWVKAIYK